jgi:hypothetical protein
MFHIAIMDVETLPRLSGITRHYRISLTVRWESPNELLKKSLKLFLTGFEPFAEGFCKLSFEPDRISPGHPQKAPSGYT